MFYLRFFFSGCPGFLPQSKDLPIMSTGDLPNVYLALHLKSAGIGSSLPEPLNRLIIGGRINKINSYPRMNNLSLAVF